MNHVFSISAEGHSFEIRCDEQKGIFGETNYRFELFLDGNPFEVHKRTTWNQKIADQSLIKTTRMLFDRMLVSALTATA